MLNFAAFLFFMSHPSSIRIEDYNYLLPESRIAKFPMASRDQSKLLVYRNGQLNHSHFHQLPELLPEKSLLVFNETKVIRARLQFRKSTGAAIEIFCLEPVDPVNDFQLAFEQSAGVSWKCFVGNAKRWKQEVLQRTFTIKGQKVVLAARKLQALSEGFLVQFSWDPASLVFSEIIEQTGLVPLPPYLNREAVADDTIRYQTVYARHKGSVAAPTAGLHFTEDVFDRLAGLGHDTTKLTLHVGAGTFKPVSTETLEHHEMHTEKIILSLDTLNQLKLKINQPIIPVGTTSMRTLESLFWMAVKLKEGNQTFVVEQWDPYTYSVPEGFNGEKALDVIIDELQNRGASYLKGETRLMIAPGYQFRFTSGLITNFHQPKSTLLLLVSALIGANWKEVYAYALKHDFRFLSYGDSCLLLPDGRIN